MVVSARFLPLPPWYLSAHRRPRDDFAIHLLVSLLPSNINQDFGHEVNSYFVSRSVIFVVKVLGSFIRRAKALL
jgi:hypothetical protein